MRQLWNGAYPAMIVSLALFSAPALAAQVAPDFSVSVGAISGGRIAVTATPPAKHHFNVYAPISIEDIGSNKHQKAMTVTEQKVQFLIGRGVGVRNLAVSIYLCDDANTYCEKHRVVTRYPEAEKQGAAPAPKPVDVRPVKADSRQSARPRIDSHGFFDNDATVAFEKADAEKLPLLIAFHAIWCPPCNMYEERVYPSAEFKRATGGFVKLKMDADAERSWKLKAKYRVTGYPTIIFATPEGDEISRIVGYRAKAEFVQAATDAVKNQGASFLALKQKADNGDLAAAAKVGLIHLQREEFATAQEYLKKAEQTPEIKEAALMAEVGLLESLEGADDQLQAVLERSLTEFPGTVDELKRLNVLAEVYAKKGLEAKRKEALDKLATLARSFIRNPARLKGADYTKGDLFQIAASAYEEKGERISARTMWRYAVAEYKPQAGTERGTSLEYAYCLWKSGEINMADRMYERLEEKYPQEFTFYFSHARLRLAQKKFDAAQELAFLAHRYSYGDNKLRAVKLLAEIHVAKGNANHALSLLKATLKSVQLPDDKKNRTHRYVRQLKDLEDKLASELAAESLKTSKTAKSGGDAATVN